MAIRTEVHVERKLPRKTTEKVNAVLSSLPREHLIGLERVRVVDGIEHPRISSQQKATIPGLYHPRQGTQRAWIELNVAALLPDNAGFMKRMLPRMAFYNNLTAVLISLIGQHYYLSLRHSVKKNSLENVVRDYTTKHLKLINESQNTFRAKLFKPLQPTLEKWSKNLSKKRKA